MNLLTDVLPTKIKVKDKIFEINYDYRTILEIIYAFEDQELLVDEQVYIMINKLYKQSIPKDYYEEACKQAIKFIDLGKEEDSQNRKDERIYSFKKDGSYICTGINQTHNIDVESLPNLHWWKFMALFMDMTSDCMFGELMYFRARKSKGKMSKEEQKRYNEIKKLVDLDDKEVKESSKERKEFMEKVKKNIPKLNF